MRSLPTLFRLVEELSKAAVSRTPFREDLLQLSRLSKNQGNQFPRLQVTPDSLSEATNGYKVTLNMANFKPNELTVKVVDNNVVVEGKYEGRRDENGYIFKKFVHCLNLPSGYKADNATSTYGTNGVLTVSIPNPPIMEDKSGEKVIPIQQTAVAGDTLKIEGKADPSMFTMQPAIAKSMSTLSKSQSFNLAAPIKTPKTMLRAGATTAAISMDASGSSSSNSKSTAPKAQTQPNDIKSKSASAPSSGAAGDTSIASGSGISKGKFGSLSKPTMPRCSPPRGLAANTMPPLSTPKIKSKAHSFTPDIAKSDEQSSGDQNDGDGDKNEKKAGGNDDKKPIGFEQAKELKSDKELNLDELQPKEQEKQVAFQQTQSQDFDVKKKDVDWDYDDFDGKDFKAKKADKKRRKMKTYDLSLKDYFAAKEDSYIDLDDDSDFDSFDFDKKKHKKYKAKKKLAKKLASFDSLDSDSDSYDFKKKKNTSYNFNKYGKNKKNKSYKNYKDY